MSVSVRAGGEVPPDVVALGVPVGSDGDSPSALVDPWSVAGVPAEALEALVPGPMDAAWLSHQGFRAKVGQTLVLRRGVGGPSVVLLGVGPGTDADAWRRAGAGFVRSAGAGGTAALLLPEGAPARAVAEGVVLGGYRFDTYRSTPKPPTVDEVVLLRASSARVLEEEVHRGVVGAAAVCLARDLVNTPAADLPPARFAERAAELLAGRPATRVEVWDEERIAAEHLGAVLAVARGSAEPPRVVVATYEPPAEGFPHVVLVGKGVTFDSGGLSLKPADSMTTMKTDMTGAAVVLGVLAACSQLGVPARVTAIAPMVENMPGGRAVKPGDVLTARNGATIEVLNTDAEGRLILADALALAVERSPDAIIDVATLTGAARVALGNGIAAVLGSSTTLVEALREAGRAAGERLWPLPMPEDYAEHIDSEVADMKNTGRAGEAGVIAGAMLLRRFIGDVPWAHLDIAATGRSSEDSGYLSKGGTAFGLRTILEFLASPDLAAAVSKEA